MSELCLGCMKENQGEHICPQCGFSKDAVQASPFLPLGTVLKNRYLVGKLIDNRADSARYMGYDKKEKTAVTIREFLPKGMFSRLEDSTVVTVREGSEERFKQLKNDFIALGRKIADFKDLTAIVSVCDVFEDNNTAYVIGEVEEVIPFGEYIKRSGGSLEWDVARPLFMPLISAMSKTNNLGLSHLAICPANLVVTPAGKVRLTSFAIKDVRQKGTDLSPQLFSGCSAPEQYIEGGTLDEKTDVYGLTATLFYALTGSLPADAVKRREDSRLLMSTNVVKKLPPHVITALASGLQVERVNRTPDFESLKSQLSAASTVQAIQEEIAQPAAQEIVEEKKEKRRLTNFQCGLIAMVIALIVFGVVGYFWYSQNPLEGMFTKNNNATENASDATDDLDEDFTYPPDSKYFRVPNLIGKTFEEAQGMASKSTEYNVFEAEEREFSDTIPEGKVCKQTPEAKKTVTRGNDGVSIAVTISKGPQYRALPNIENVTKDEAAKELTQHGFVVNSTLDYSDSVPEGSVISYSGNNKVGDKLEYGSTVTITISLGTRPEAPSEKTFYYED